MAYSKSTQDGQLDTILITGGCGFIGTNLVKYLANKGYQIRILDDLSAGKEENLRELQSQDSRLTTITLIVDDIRNRDVVSQTVKGADAVVHLAAHASVADSLENPEETWDINVSGTLNLLEACRQNGVEKFIFASSSAMLGEQVLPVDETKVPKPLSPYGASKLAGEALCSAYCHSFGLKTISLRFGNCYGPYSEHKSSVIAGFVKRAKEGEPLIIYGDGNQTRDFVHIDDVCQAIYLSLTIPDSGLSTPGSYGEAFQIASGGETTINELVEVIKEVTGRNLPIIHKPERQGDIKRNYANISKARAMLGFEPKVELKEGLKKLWSYMLQKSGSIVNK